VCGTFLSHAYQSRHFNSSASGWVYEALAEELRQPWCGVLKSTYIIQHPSCQPVVANTKEGRLSPHPPPARRQLLGLRRFRLHLIQRTSIRRSKGTKALNIDPTVRPNWPLLASRCPAADPSGQSGPTRQSRWPVPLGTAIFQHYNPVMRRRNSSSKPKAPQSSVYNTTLWPQSVDLFATKRT